MVKVNCINCGPIENYAIVSSPHKNEGDDFKYSKCECGSQQPLCLGCGCIDVIELSCPENENKKCLEIIEKKNVI